MKVIITGSGGFIGAHLCRYFYEQLHCTVIGWNLTSGNLPWSVKIVNLNNIDEIQQELLVEKPDLIIHCAGAADVGKSVQNPEMDFENNVTITHNLFFAIHKGNIRNVRVLFLSSAGVYGNPSKLPITEGTLLNPLSPYALHKVMCEEICKYFYNNYDIDVKIARIFSAYGEGLKKQIFWDMNSKILKNGCLEMWGTGNESRDYIYIDDLVVALSLIAIHAPEHELVYNVANGAEITIRQAAECFATSSKLDYKLIKFNGETKEGDPINWRADISKLRKLGYIQSVTFEEGVSKYYEWVSKQ